MRLFDSHSHIQGDAFDEDIAEVVARAGSAGVETIVVCGDDPAVNLKALELAARYDSLVPTVGFHPYAAKDVTDADFATLEQQVARDDVVAVGELGLDYFREPSPRDMQDTVLNRQLDIAVAVGKPVIVHSRGAESEIFENLEPYAKQSPLEIPGVMHCFGGTLEQALRYLELGFMVSLACAVTYPKNEEARRVAAGLPLESLLIETDSPYLPPQGKRGERNEPAYVVRAAEAIAAARDETVERVAEVTTENAMRLFGLRVAGGASV